MVTSQYKYNADANRLADCRGHLGAAKLLLAIRAFLARTAASGCSGTGRRYGGVTELASCQQFSNNQNAQHIGRLIRRTRFRANESHAGLVGGLAGGEAPVPWRTAAAAPFPPGHVKRQSASSTCVRGVVEDVGAVNMIMETLGALALATEPPNNELMKRIPVGRKGSFISNVMWRNIMGQTFYQFLVIWYLQAEGKWLFEIEGDDSDLVLNTIIFNCFYYAR
ncbi:calcium-transporting ATPase 2, plasma membrane-type-like [Panicum miliaceum]|uniref:Calcium-transporting ATPase 2, plasma membrane-type-like n=1 Tax=Panicum miliaceum TaxID=4540 RepID=A0A3L6Q7Q0_PANMI|nr:calcium-transporting ATPase 2, plasma membrane-type-like [Panicum miliaceum]